MKKITLFLSIILIISSCTTVEYIEVPIKPDGKQFPLTPGRIILQDDPVLNEIMLMENIIEWKIRDIKIKYILKMITEEQYQIWFDEDMEAMKTINNTYNMYWKSKENN